MTPASFKAILSFSGASRESSRSVLMLELRALSLSHGNAL